MVKYKVIRTFEHYIYNLLDILDKYEVPYLTSFGKEGFMGNQYFIVIDEFNFNEFLKDKLDEFKKEDEFSYRFIIEIEDFKIRDRFESSYKIKNC